MKRIKMVYGKYIALLFLMLLILGGCKGKSDKLRIAYLYPSDELSRFNKEGNYIKNYAEKNGVEVIIKTAGYDESVQAQQAKELIEEGIDALIIVAVNINTSAAIVREAKDNGVPVLAYNRMIRNSDVDFFVASSNDLIGKIMVDAVMNKMDSGNVVILNGDKFDKNAIDLQKSIHKYLQKSIDENKVHIIYESYISSWSKSISAYEMDKVISLYGTDINAVIAGFDGMSDGVIDVLKKYDLNGKVFVTGQDAEISACKNLLSGDQIVTVFHPLKTIAETAAQIAIEMAQGHSLKEFENSTENNGKYEVPTHRVNSIAVTKDNLDKVLIKSGFYKKEDIY